MPLPRHVEMDTWPTATTICQVCGLKMIYFIYADQEQETKRRVPKKHDWPCDYKKG